MAWEADLTSSSSLCSITDLSGFAGCISGGSCNLTVKDNGTAITSNIAYANGTQTGHLAVTLSSLSVGSHIISIEYSGDGDTVLVEFGSTSTALADSATVTVYAFASGVTATDLLPYVSSSYSYILGEYTATEAGVQLAFQIQSVAAACVTSNGIEAVSAANCTSGTVTYIDMDVNGLSLSASLYDSTGNLASVQPVVTNLTGGRYGVALSTTTAGVYSLTVSFTAGSTVNVFDLLSNAQLTVYSGPGYPSQFTAPAAAGGANSTAGSRTTITVNLFDRYGNAVSNRPFDISQDHFEANVTFLGTPALTAVELDALSNSLKYNQINSSQTQVLFLLQRAGSYSVEVGFLGQETYSSTAREKLLVPIPGSPFSLTVQPGTISGLNTQLYGAGFVSVAAAFAAAGALEPMSLLIVGYDPYGNIINHGGDASTLYLEVLLRGQTTALSVNYTDNANGTYTASFLPQAIGIYDVSLFVSGVKVLPEAQLLAGLSFTANGTISKIATDPSRCVAIGTGVNAAVAGDLTSFYIQAKDPKGQDKTVGGDSFVVIYEPYNVTNATQTVIYNDYGILLLPGDLTSDVVDMQSAYDTGDLSAVPGQYLVSYTITNFGIYRLNITLNGINIGGSPFLLNVTRRLPPVQGPAYFEPSGTALTVSFVELGGGYSLTNRARLVGLANCSEVFTPDSLTSMGESPLCTFPVAQTLTVYLGYNATISPGNAVTYLPNTILNKDENSDAVKGSSNVALPDTAPAPTLVIRAPAKLGLCDNLTIDMSGSFGAAGRPLTFLYGMLPNVPNQNIITDLLYNATVSHSTVFTIPGNLLQIGTNYTFKMQGTSFLLQSSTLQFQVARYNYTLPRVLIMGNSVILGYHNRPLWVMADVQVTTQGPAGCTIDFVPQFTFEWSFDTASYAAQKLPVTTFPLDSKTYQTRTLYIDAGSLAPGVIYFLRFTATVVGYPELTNYGTVAVQAQYSPIVVGLEAPSMILTNRQLTIDMSQSYDPSDDTVPFVGINPPPPLGPFIFGWDCRKMDSLGNVLTDPCFVDDHGYLSPDPLRPNATFPAGLLARGSYMFYVTVQKDPLVGSDGASLGRLVQVRFISVTYTLLLQPERSRCYSLRVCFFFVPR